MDQLSSNQGGTLKAAGEENPFCEDILLFGQEKCVEDWPEGSPEHDPSWRPPGKLRLRRETLKVAVEMKQSSGGDLDENGLARSDKLKKGKRFKVPLVQRSGSKCLDESLQKTELLKETEGNADVQDRMHNRGKKFKMKFLSLRTMKETHQEGTNRENLYTAFRGIKSTTELRDTPPGVSSGRSPPTGAAEPGQQSSLMDTMLSEGPEAERTEDGKKGDTESLKEEWSQTAEQWNKMTLEDKELIEKEEAKALPLLADRVQGGIHDFNRVFNEHAEGLWQHIGTLNAIADDINSLNKRAKVPSIIIPVNRDTSLNVRTMEMGVPMKGSPSPASASVCDNLSNSMEHKNLESMMEDCRAKLVDINKCLGFVKLEMEKLQAHGEQRKEWTYHTDWEVRRALQIAMVGGDRVSQAVSVVCMVMGELASFVQGMDSFYIKDTCELKKNTKKEFASKIREMVQHFQEQLMELNCIREELQDAIGYI